MFGLTDLNGKFEEDDSMYISIVLATLANSTAGSCSGSEAQFYTFRIKDLRTNISSVVSRQATLTGTLDKQK